MDVKQCHFSKAPRDNDEAKVLLDALRKAREPLEQEQV
jgi:hypothetical protein